MCMSAASTSKLKTLQSAATGLPYAGTCLTSFCVVEHNMALTFLVLLPAAPAPACLAVWVP